MKWYLKLNGRKKIHVTFLAKSGKKSIFHDLHDEEGATAGEGECLSDGYDISCLPPSLHRAENTLFTHPIWVHPPTT